MSASKEPDAEELRVAILKSLEGQGFQIEGRNILPPPELSKDKLRQLHRPAVEHRIGRSRARLVRKELILLQRFASGSEVNPTRISPRLVEVQPDSDDELLFRYACLRWSVPVSPGYGRRLRFLILDDFNNKLIGLFGLGDPVFSLEARDKWVGWTTEMRRQRLRHVLDAFVVGAVSPYAELLCGKLVAMLLSCNEVRETFTRKYKGRKSLISGKALDSRVAMVTTMSALGKSSVYNRLNFEDRRLFLPVGYTKGSGEFHFSNGLYQAMSHYASANCAPTAKNSSWGTGFRSRREVIRKSLAHLGLSEELLYHRIKREIFVIPLARNTTQFLSGEESRLYWHRQSARQITESFKKRWLLPRIATRLAYRDFQPSPILAETC